MKTLHLTTLAVLSAAALSASAFARPTTDSNLAEMYQVVNNDPTDVSTRLRLAGYLQQLGLVEESNAVLKEVSVLGGDLDLMVDAVDGCPECVRGTNGPDVIVGDLNGVAYHGRFEVAPDVWVMSYSTGTTSCNIGNQQLEWFQLPNNRHPVISQTVYRVKDNVLTQLGQGWLKHGFFALSQQLCNSGCQGTNGQWLGVNCSDPYTAGRNGTWSLLGPKFVVRASSGYFPTGSQPGGTGTPNLTARRVQVAQSDLNPAMNPGAIYFTDGQYVQWQDAQFENDNNNSSWRRFQFTYNSNNTPNNPDDDTISFPSFVGSTVRMETPVDAWQNFVPTVEIADVIIPNDSNIQNNGTAGPVFWSGRFHVGNNVVENGEGGSWTYVYSIYNQNSDRSARSFTIPVAGAITVTDAGFNDVAYHSGDGMGNTNVDGTNWTFVRGANDVSWSTQTFAQNQNANALRWGTTYTFWFTADSGPQDTLATIGLYRPGSDADPEVSVRGPACLLAWDLDDDGDVGFSDLNILLGEYGSTYSFADLNELLGSYGESCN